MKGIEHVLKLNETIIIPAKEKHALKITEDFQAVVKAVNTIHAWKFSRSACSLFPSSPIHTSNNLL